MNAVQCDYCGKFAPNPDNLYRDSYGGKLPDGWFTIAVTDGGTNAATQRGGLNEFGEFCSRACSSEHFARERRAEAA